MTKLRKSLLAVLCVASLGAAALPATVSAAPPGIYFNIAPPPPRVEVVPDARRGYVWVPGYWDARGRRHVWIAGHWERARRGYSYVEPRWIERNNRWYLERGRWNRGDRDRDGIPNARDRDRDGDGVPNRRDNAPNNPNRR